MTLERITGVICALTFWVGSAVGASLTVAPIADTCMRSTEADRVFGDGNPLLVGNSKEPFSVHNRALFKFDLSAIPTNAVVTNATLAVFLFRSNSDEAQFDAHRMLVDWGEYETTWNRRFASIPWLEGGGQAATEFVSQASATGGIEESTFISAGIIADAQFWVKNPAQNFGWIMLPTDDLPGTGKQVGSRESDYTPLLTVEYSTNAPPAAPKLLGTGLARGGIRFSFKAEALRAYTIEASETMTDCNWEVLATLPLRTNQGIINYTNEISGPFRYYRINTR
jgi:hypothetical protein